MHAAGGLVDPVLEEAHAVRALRCQVLAVRLGHLRGRRAGLDLVRARKDAASGQSTKRLREEAEDIIALQVTRTPTFYVNGKLLVDFGAQQLMNLVTSEVKAATTPAEAAPSN